MEIFHRTNWLFFEFRRKIKIIAVSQTWTLSVLTCNSLCYHKYISQSWSHFYMVTKQQEIRATFTILFLVLWCTSGRYLHLPILKLRQFSESATFESKYIERGLSDSFSHIVLYQNLTAHKVSPFPAFPPWDATFILRSITSIS